MDIRLETFLSIVDVVDLFFDFYNLIVKFFQKSFVLGLLLLGFFKLKQLVGKFFLESSGFFHEHLLVLHVDNEGFVKLVEFLFSLFSSISFKI
jgi:hypothetical protein